jgi:hypothetical protein
MTCYTKNSSSRLHNLPRYMHIYIWENRWSHMAPKPMSTVGSAGNSIYYLQYANSWLLINITFHLWFLLPYTCSTLYLILYGFSNQIWIVYHQMFFHICHNCRTTQSQIYWNHASFSLVHDYFYYRIHVVPCIWFCMDSLVFSEIHIVTTCNCLSTKF